MAEEIVQRVLAESSPDDPVFTGGELDEVLGVAITGTVHRTVAAQFTSSRVLFFLYQKQILNKSPISLAFANCNGGY